MNDELLWQQCLQLIAGKVSSRVFDTWFKDITIESYDADNNAVVLSVPHRYVYEYIEEQHVSLMDHVLGTAFKPGVRLGYRIRKEPVATIDYPETPQIPQFSIANARERMENGLKKILKTDTPQWLPAYDQVAEWLSDNKGRGLLCIGTSGLGKTLICEKILPVILGRKIKTVTADELYDHIDDILKERAVIIDDLGKEPAKRYGQPDTSFYKLCDAAERNGILLIITTNLATTPVSDANRAMYPLSIQERYGNEVLSRLRAITKAVGFRGEDMRGQRP